MNAKDTFLSRITGIENALSLPPLMAGGTIGSPAYENARMLRNGLAVISFTTLEDFFKKRMGEFIAGLGTLGVHFNQLPKPIQEASTLRAISSVLTIAKRKKKKQEDWLGFIQSEATKIASSGQTHPFGLSEYSMGYDKSNIDVTDIPTFLKILCVEGGWTAIHQLTIKAGATVLSPETVFRTAAGRRHAAAHNPSANSLWQDIKDFLKDSKSIAFAFDSLCNRSYTYVQNHNSDFLNGTTKTKHSDISVRQLRLENNRWKEFPPNAARAYRSHPDFQTGYSAAYSRSRQHGQYLVQLENIGELKNWSF